MAGLRRELSSIGPLIAFEAAARLGNFTAAADELGMTRVAVSRQVKDLELDLDVALFRRLRRGVALTAAGEDLFAGVAGRLREIAATKARIRRAQRPAERVVATMTVAFATFWLIPRLGRFRAAHPGIDLRLAISDRYLDLAGEGVDVAIRYGAAAAGENRGEFLFRETLLAVCSPHYAARTALAGPADLLGECLIHLEGAYRPEAKWPNWFRSFGLSLRPDVGGISVDAYANMVQAALEGQGIALCGTPLVDHLLASGALIRAVDAAPLQRDDYVLLRPRAAQPNDATRAFCAWVMTEAGRDPRPPADTAPADPVASRRLEFRPLDPGVRSAED